MSERIYYSTAAQEVAEKQRRNTALTFMALGLMAGSVLSLIGVYRNRLGNPKKIGKQVSKQIEAGADLTNGALKKLEEQYQSLRQEVDHMISSVRG
ncbi:MAG TPA: hypothetical protein VHP83_09105 [Aggregatilineaceae bacterium]|nr:hypothetical protein [Aggregatilineaceae bacterium]